MKLYQNILHTDWAYTHTHTAFQNSRGKQSYVADFNFRNLTFTRADIRLLATLTTGLDGVPLCLQTNSAIHVMKGAQQAKSPSYKWIGRPWNATCSSLTPSFPNITAPSQQEFQNSVTMAIGHLACHEISVDQSLPKQNKLEGSSTYTATLLRSPIWQQWESGSW